MLGVLLLFWIGKYFYKLAEEYSKNKWGYAILGIVVYYGGIFLFSSIAGIIIEVISPGSFKTFNKTLFGLIILPFGISSCYILYKYLERKWEKNKPDSIDLIKGIDKPDL